MKKTVNLSALILLVIVFVFSLSSCAKAPSDEDIWQNALFMEDTELGEGKKELLVEVSAQDRTVVFTINTDKETVGDALFEHELIDGDAGQYGLYVKVVNGIRADFDKDKHYWAFYEDGTYANQGVDMTTIKEGVTYKLERTR